MNTSALQKRKQGFIPINMTAWSIMVIMVLGMLGIAGCGSTITGVDIPKEFIQDFLGKHETMVDKSLIYYYAKEDQPIISEQIELACRINESKGKLEVLEKATFDFSNLQMELVDKKEDYVNDEPVIFIKVAVKGNYKMLLPEETKVIDADELIVLQMARNEWKVLESQNPWS